MRRRPVISGGRAARKRSSARKTIAILIAVTACAVMAVKGYTKPGNPTPLNNSGSFVHYPEQEDKWETVRMRVTAYCPCRKCCGKYSDGKTACLYKIRQGDVFVAADKKYKFGTEMMIPGYNDGKVVKVLDRGRVIKGNRLDVFFNSHKTATKWGVQYLDVKVRRK